MKRITFLLVAVATLAGGVAFTAVHKTCVACHAPAKDRDFVFTRYAP